MAKITSRVKSDIMDGLGQSQISPATSDNQTNGLQKTKIVDNTGVVCTMESNGAMPVNIQDQHSAVVDMFLLKPISVPTLAATYTPETRTVTMNAGHNIVAGNYLNFYEGSHFSQVQVTNVNVNVITIDRYLDYAFTAAANIVHGNENMNVDGSVTPQVFKITPVGSTAVFDITRFIFSLEDNSAMDSGTFGGLTALTNGVVVRKKDSYLNTLFNVKTNGGLGLHCDVLQYDNKAPSGVYGLTAIRKLAGQAESGVTLRLDPATSEELQVIIQDNLTGLTNMRVVVQGHVVIN